MVQTSLYRAYLPTMLAVALLDVSDDISCSLNSLNFIEDLEMNFWMHFYYVSVIYSSTFSLTTSNGISIMAMYILYFMNALGERRALTGSLVVLTWFHKSNLKIKWRKKFNVYKKRVTWKWNYYVIVILPFWNSLQMEIGLRMNFKEFVAIEKKLLGKSAAQTKSNANYAQF
jgi:hypothetical protein